MDAIAQSLLLFIVYCLNSLPQTYLQCLSAIVLTRLTAFIREGCAFFHSCLTASLYLDRDQIWLKCHLGKIKYVHFVFSTVYL